MNPFLKYRGIWLNGLFIETPELDGLKGKDSFEEEVISYCQQLFDESAFISIQTSGSTGTPKELEFPKSALIQSAAATNDYFHLNSESRALLSLPLNYVAAKLMVVRAITGEYDLVTIKPTSNPLKDRKEAVCFIPMTPHQVKSVLAESPEAFDHVATVLLGGGEVSIELKAELLKQKPTFYMGFGMAETLTHIALSKIGEAVETIYTTLPDVSIDRDERGCLIINRPGVTHGSLVTNDLIEITEGGFKWLGRTDNLINSGGIKIIPEEVEKLLKPNIDSNFFVAGISDPVLGQKVALFIQGSETPDLDAIVFSKPHQKPKKIIHLDNFSYTESGKIQRRETINRWMDATAG